MMRMLTGMLKGYATRDEAITAATRTGCPDAPIRMLADGSFVWLGQDTVYGSNGYAAQEDPAQVVETFASA